MRAAVGDAHEHLNDAGLLERFAGPASQGDDGAAAWFRADFQVVPGDARAPADSQGLQNRLLRRPSAREMLRGLVPAMTVLDFVRGLDATKEGLAVALDHSRDTEAFGNIRAHANDVSHACSRATETGSCAKLPYV